MPTAILFKTSEDGSASPTERLRITSDGKIGIGITNPDGLLTIKGNSDEVTTPSIRLLDGTDTREVSITNTAGDFVVSTHGTDDAIHGRIKIFESGIIQLENGGASGTIGTRLKIQTDGDVGINTTNPVNRLFVEEPTGTNATRTLVTFRKNHTTTTVSGNTAKDSFPHALMLENADNSADTGLASLGFTKFTTGAQSQVDIVGESTDAGTMDLTFHTELSNTISEKLRITSDGLIGIGTDNPDQTLELFKASGTNLVKVTTQANSTVGLEIEKTGSTTQSWRIVDGQTVNGALEFYDVTNTATRMIIRDGKVGINESNPGVKLHIVDTVQVKYQWTRFQVLIVGDDSGTDGESSAIFMVAINATNRGIKILSERQSSNNNHDLIFQTSPDGAVPTEKLRITSDGNLQRPKSLSQEVSTSVSSTSATSCGSFAKATYRSAYVIAQITQGSSYQVGRYLVIHDGTTATTIEESAIATGDMLGTFNGVVSGSNVEFRVTMSSASSATVITKIESIVV